MARNSKADKSILFLYSCFHGFFASKIDAQITKRIFLLTIYSYLTKEIDFTDLLYIVNELGFHLNKYGDLIEKDHNLATTFLDLDEIDIKTLDEKKIKKHKEFLSKYYSSLAPRDLYIKEEVLNKYIKRNFENMDFSSVKTYLTSLIRGYIKGSLTLGELLAIIKKVYAKVCKIQEKTKLLGKNSRLVYLLGSALELIPSLFFKPIERENIKNILKEIELISSNFPDDPSCKTGN